MNESLDLWKLLAGLSIFLYGMFLLEDAIKAMSGSPHAFREMLAKMNHGGHIALLGIMPDDTAIDWGQVVFKGLKLKGIYGREMFETWYKMTAMLQSGLDMSPVITHNFAAEDFQKGFDVMRSGKSGKVILDWNA